MLSLPKLLSPTAYKYFLKLLVFIFFNKVVRLDDETIILTFLISENEKYTFERSKKLNAEQDITFDCYDISFSDLPFWALLSEVSLPSAPLGCRMGFHYKPVPGKYEASTAHWKKLG